MLKVNVSQIELLDEVAAGAVPAGEVRDIDGWAARCTPGLATRRANSVWPHTHTAAHHLGAKLDAVERFYLDHG